MVANAVAFGAEQATYNVLLVFDGALAIDSGQKGQLQVFYDAGLIRTWLNDPDAEPLSAVFKDVGEPYHDV
jgi:hypothetical protein